MQEWSVSVEPTWAQLGFTTYIMDGRFTKAHSPWKLEWRPSRIVVGVKLWRTLASCGKAQHIMLRLFSYLSDAFYPKWLALNSDAASLSRREGGYASCSRLLTTQGGSNWGPVGWGIQLLTCPYAILPSLPNYKLRPQRNVYFSVFKHWFFFFEQRSNAILNESMELDFSHFQVWISKGKI